MLARFYDLPAGDDELSKEIIRARLQDRASSLMSLSPPGMGMTLAVVWPNGLPPATFEDRNYTDNILWQQILLNLGGCVPAPMSAASHFLKILEAGLDANKICFPRQALRHGIPKPLPPLTPACNLTAQDGNTLPFPQPGVEGHKDKITMAMTTGIWSSDSEDEIGAMWLDGLARHSFQLRAPMHKNTATFNAELTPWPMKPANVINEIFIGPLAHNVMNQEFRFEIEQMIVDPKLIDEHRYLRGEIHADKCEFATTADPWPRVQENVIKDDIPTPSQHKVMRFRETCGPLSKEQLEKRRTQLFEKLSGPYQMLGEMWPNPRFFEETSPLGKEATSAQARLRKAAEKVHTERLHEEAAEIGAQYVAWPVLDTRCWPKPAPAWMQFSRRFAKRRGLAQCGQPCSSPKTAKLAWFPFTDLSVMHNLSSEVESALPCQDMLSKSAWLRFVDKMSSTSTPGCDSTPTVKSAWQRFVHKLGKASSVICELESSLGPGEACASRTVIKSKSAWRRFVDKLRNGSDADDSVVSMASAWTRFAQELRNAPSSVSKQSSQPREESCYKSAKSAWRGFVDQLASTCEMELTATCQEASTSPKWCSIVRKLSSTPTAKCESSAGMESAWLRMLRLSIARMSFDASDDDWEALSECSESSSWQWTSEVDTGFGVAWEPESNVPTDDSAADIPYTTAKLCFSRADCSHVGIDCDEATLEVVHESDGDWDATATQASEIVHHIIKVSLERKAGTSDMVM